MENNQEHMQGPVTSAGAEEQGRISQAQGSQENSTERTQTRPQLLLEVEQAVRAQAKNNGASKAGMRIVEEPAITLAALCLSGGGIRSASFCLGVVQALAKRGWLKEFHYLSTVSGGGYVGSWLTSWIRRLELAREVLTENRRSCVKTYRVITKLNSQALSRELDQSLRGLQQTLRRSCKAIKVLQNASSSSIDVAQYAARVSQDLDARVSSAGVIAKRVQDLVATVRPQTTNGNRLIAIYRRWRLKNQETNLSLAVS
jgi:hypothetical protein